jgi:hypothetical protein
MKEILSMTALKRSPKGLTDTSLLDNLVMAYLTRYSDPKYPILEIGVYRGDSALPLYEAARQQMRELHLVDNFSFLETQSGIKRFINEVLMPNLAEVDPDLRGLNVYVESSLEINFTRKFSFFHIDTPNPAADIETCLRLAAPRSVICLDDFLHMPEYIDAVVYAVQAGKLFPFMLGVAKIWCTNDPEFSRELSSQPKIYEDLGSVFRVARRTLLGHDVVKVFSLGSKRYRATMDELRRTYR